MRVLALASQKGGSGKTTLSGHLAVQAQLAGIEVGKPETYHGQIRPILANANIFGSDLTAIGMADRIEEMFVSELAGEGAVRKTLEAYLG